MANARVLLRSRERFDGIFRGQPPTGPDGRFTIPDVPPGDYLIEAQSGGNMRPTAVESFETDRSLSTSQGATFDLVITMTTGATVTGRVIYESPSTQNRPDRVRPQPADPRTPMRFGPDDGAVAFGRPVSVAWTGRPYGVSRRYWPQRRRRRSLEPQVRDVERS